MSPLRDLQVSFRDFVLGGDPGALADQFAAPVFATDDVLAIHRNNFRLTLTGALASIFPALEALVGTACFAALAGDFVRRHPPANPVLSAYGEKFPKFIEAHPSLSGVPYLGDVGRLEWAWNEAFHARDARALTPEDLRRAALLDQDDIRLGLHPSVRLVASPYPVHRIWRMARHPREHEGDIDLTASAEHILVARPDLEVTVTPVDLGTYSLLRAIGTGRAIRAAAEVALKTAPEFSIEGSLGSLIARGVFASITQKLEESTNDELH